MTRHHTPGGRNGTAHPDGGRDGPDPGTRDRIDREPRSDDPGPGTGDLDPGTGNLDPRTDDVASDDPNVLSVVVPAGPVGRGYARLRAGDVVAEGDRGPVPGAIGQWRVTAITPDLVAARDRRTGRSVAWDRAWLERQLATGGMSTGLSEFVRVAVRPVRSVAGRRVDPPGLRAVVYGDDGRRYERVYRPVAGGSGSRSPALELYWEDRSTSRLPRALRTSLDRRVATTLADAGYDVRPE